MTKLEILIETMKFGAKTGAVDFKTIRRFLSQLNELMDEGEIFNILTKELPYDIKTTRFSIRKRVAKAIKEWWDKQ